MAGRPPISIKVLQATGDINKVGLLISYTNKGGNKNGTPMLLEGGMKFNPHTINPADAQLLESKSF